MASLRLKFPEKDEPSLIVLSGARVTLGRLPLNTIQIIDRTLSGFHAEFVLEEDHYRLHDRGSTNGTFVNGESVTDFHLREACKVAFGALECEFSPETPASAENPNLEALPTRSEINAVRLENAELKSRAEALREESEALRKKHSAEAAAGQATVAQEDYDKLLAERESLKEAQYAAQQEITRLKTDLALMQRDRENLKKVAASAQAEFANFRAEPATAKDETPAAQIDAPAPAPTAASLPKPSVPLPIAAKVAPKPPGSLPTVPGRLPVAPRTGLRPLPVASPAPASSSTAAPVATSAPKLPLQSPPTPPTPASKGGTQKIDPDAAPPIKPAAPMAKLPMKPPVKLPLQPTVRLQPALRPPKAGGPIGDDQAAG